MEIKNKVKECKLKPIKELLVLQGELKKLTKENKDKLKKSILKYGFAMPLFIWKDNNYILDGTQRIKVIIELLKEGHTLETEDKLPIVEIEAKDKKEAAELILTISNQYGKITDEGLLEFGKEFELDFNELTETINLEFPQDLFNEENELNDVEPDDPRMIETEIKKGEVYKLGEHKLMCGDATSEEDIKKLMEEDKADMVFTDPPYSVNYEKKTKEIFKDKSYNNIENDDLNVNDISKKIWRPSFKNMYLYSKEDCSFYMTMPQGGDQMMMMMMMMMSENWKVKHELIWIKPSPVFSMGRLDYDYKHEPIIYGWKNKHNFYGNGKYKKSVWEIGRDTDKLHPTMKPIELIVNCLENSSLKNNIVLDVFGGSGSTLIACENTNRKCRMMEIDQIYCQVIINRWERLTGNKAEKVN